MKYQWFTRTYGSILSLLFVGLLWPAQPANAQPLNESAFAPQLTGGCGICLMLPTPGTIPGTCTEPDSCAPIRERIKLWDIKTHPNPATEWLQISIEGGYEPTHVGVRIVDMNEIRYFERQALGARDARLPVEFLPPGPYLLQLTLHGEVLSTHRIKIYR